MNQGNINQDKREVWFCCLPSPLWVAICGITSVLIGTLWLLDELGFFSYFWWDLVVPILLIVWGAGYVITYLIRYHRE